MYINNKHQCYNYLFNICIPVTFTTNFTLQISKTNTSQPITIDVEKDYVQYPIIPGLLSYGYKFDGKLKITQKIEIGEQKEIQHYLFNLFRNIIRNNLQYIHYLKEYFVIFDDYFSILLSAKRKNIIISQELQGIIDYQIYQKVMEIIQSRQIQVIQNSKLDKYMRKEHQEVLPDLDTEELIPLDLGLQGNIHLESIVVDLVQKQINTLFNCLNISLKVQGIQLAGETTISIPKIEEIFQDNIHTYLTGPRRQNFEFSDQFCSMLGYMILSLDNLINQYQEKMNQNYFKNDEQNQEYINFDIQKYTKKYTEYIKKEAEKIIELNGQQQQPEQDGHIDPNIPTDGQMKRKTTLEQILTLSNVVRVIDKNQQNADKKIEKLEGNVQILTDNVQTLDNKIQTLDNKVQTLDNKIQTLDNKIQTLDNKVQILQDDVAGIHDNIDYLTTRMDNTDQNNYRIFGIMMNILTVNMPQQSQTFFMNQFNQVQRDQQQQNEAAQLLLQQRQQQRQQQIQMQQQQDQQIQQLNPQQQQENNRFVLRRIRIQDQSEQQQHQQQIQQQGQFMPNIIQQNQNQQQQFQQQQFQPQQNQQNQPSNNNSFIIQ